MIDPADARLREVVSQALPGADEDAVSIVAACAGLLGGVAYADRAFSDDEAAKVERLLGTVKGIEKAGSRAIAQAIRANAVELSTVFATRFARTLRELGEPELRLHVLGMLVELAAADDVISQTEVNLMRQITGELGLTQDDYNRLQSEHRQKLETLRHGGLDALS